MFEEMMSLIEQYLDGKVSEAELDHWEFTHISAIEASGDERLRHLAGYVRGGLYLVDDGHITLERFNEKLRETVGRLRAEAA